MADLPFTPLDQLRIPAGHCQRRAASKKAADSLLRDPAAVSLQIQNLEKQLGM